MTGRKGISEDFMEEVIPIWNRTLRRKGYPSRGNSKSKAQRCFKLCDFIHFRIKSWKGH